MLDSWPLVSWLRNEPAAPQVEQILAEQAACRCLLHICTINLGEVFYAIARRRGLGQAQMDVAALRPCLHVLPAPGDLVMRAAALKAAHRISYADGFAVATALELEAPLVTGDPEIRELSRALPQLALHWLGN
ncbi:MAG: type II toxin-antitoxin system VapC family toxin [Terriglobales bacterium]